MNSIKRTRLNTFHWILLISLLAMLSSKNPRSAFAFEPTDEVATDPQDNLTSPAKVTLGRQLYFDKRLSADNTVSCQSCHNVMTNGTDSLATSKGIRSQVGGRNAPTVFDAAFHSVQFWDGRAASLEEQAKGPLINPIEMGMKDHAAVIEKVRSIAGYHTAFAGAFGSANASDSITIDNLAKAIAAYERTLISKDSPFNRFQRGDKKAMSALAQKGMATFQEVGCTTCHMGPNFAGPKMPPGTGFYMRFPTYSNNEYVKQYDLLSDQGRYAHTKKNEDKHLWRVPSLRNAAITAPYFHNGKVKTLDEAVRVMGKVQLNKDLTGDQVTAIVAFLKTLPGKRPHEKEPVLPQ